MWYGETTNLTEEALGNQQAAINTQHSAPGHNRFVLSVLSVFIRGEVLTFRSPDVPIT